MALRIVRLGSPRQPDEGLRIGTVRRPPRGVPRERIAAEGFYDVWFPNLAPSPEVMKLGQEAQTEAAWAGFRRAYLKELDRPEARHAIGLLAALSHTTQLSVGCYCADEARCHRSLLRERLVEAGAEVVPSA